MTSQLPLVIRRDIRDQVESEKAPLREALKALKQTLGCSVSTEVDWNLIWGACESKFENKASFVPWVVSHITALFDALQTKLEDEESEWTETFLERIERKDALEITVQLQNNQPTHIKLTNDSTFVLGLSLTSYTSSVSSQALLQDLDGIFSSSSQPTSTEYNQEASGSMIDTDTSDFGDVNSVFTPTSSVFNLPSKLVPRLAMSQPQPLQTITSLARPDILLSKVTTHIIHLRLERNRQTHLTDRIIVQTTHEPSLKLLYDYFLKWTRSDPQTREKVPLLRHTLGASCLGPGLSHDTLVTEPFSQISARSGATMNVAIYQAFIESVLGYEIVHRGEASSEMLWEYRRSIPFS